MWGVFQSAVNVGGVPKCGETGWGSAAAAGRVLVAAGEHVPRAEREVPRHERHPERPQGAEGLVVAALDGVAVAGALHALVGEAASRPPDTPGRADGGAERSGREPAGATGRLHRVAAHEAGRGVVDV